MANTTAKKQIHVSPGIYFSESEISAATTSLGITHLGLAGETVKGPAFQVIDISNWAQYQQFFGGTSTEKFRGSKYPKYELPYIAKTYLEQSQSLKVVRTLGLSGVNAGPAWFITAYGDSNSDYTQSKPMLVAVLRSRGEHMKASFKSKGTGGCPDIYQYDTIKYYAESVLISPSKSMELLPANCTSTWNTNTPNDINISATDYGTFDITVQGSFGTKTYTVSLNPGTKNYIINVLGTDPEKGETEIFVEELYDVALRQLVDRETPQLTFIAQGELKYDYAVVVPKYREVYDILTNDESTLKRRDVGRRFLYSTTYSVDGQRNALKVHERQSESDTWSSTTGTSGKIYTVKAITMDDGTRTYYYCNTATDNDEVQQSSTLVDGRFEEAVYVQKQNVYYKKETSDVMPITLDLNNYKEQYRYASTPWIVSEVKGKAEHMEMTKLFRFHTISDGNSSSTEVKISIENIMPDEGKFDVVVRDFYDTDASQSIIETFRGVDLIPGSDNYIAYRIGSFDDSYETKSNYITVEVNETDLTKISSPCGFLGYPIRDYNGTAPVTVGDINRIKAPFLKYNTDVDDTIRIRKQYFGLSNLVGIDEDVFKYKGVEAYNDEPSGLTPCFHLDSRINSNNEIDGLTQNVYVDGVNGYVWSTVGKNNVIEYQDIEPRMGSEELMLGTIYEDKRYRKFTVCFYGGWDGWDYYRTSRSNSDDFKWQKYRGYINKETGEGENFSFIKNPETYGFDETDKVITSDYYAYLSAIRQFANPKETDINVFATPGIDYVNNNLLVQETIEMIEDERADSIYVITTPDKPFGAGDTKGEMYTASDAVDNLDGSEIDSNWACTYYPWVKYFDGANSQYIYLPPTKDVVKNFAYTDNVAHPWIASAGWFRGLTDGIKSKKTLVLSEQDELYSGRINFINNFADEGMRIWGDKNLQVEQNSQLSRISKRRCLIRLRKLISIACIGLIFDPNDNTTSQSFRSAVEPILENFISNRGLMDAKLVVDDSQESRDRLEINAQIYLKFVPNVEYINIGLKVTPSGVSFDDL